MKKITVKLILAFTALILVSSLLSFVVATLFTPNLRHEIRLNQEAIAHSIMDLSKKTDLPIEDILEIVSTFMYDAKIIDDPASLPLTLEEWEQIKSRQLVGISTGPFGGSATYLILDETAVEIRLQPHNTIFKITASRTWLSGISFVVIGALLIIILTRRMVRPVLRLTAATQEIAKGNFQVSIAHEADDEIGQLTRNFNIMARELQCIDTLRKDFISNVSHEFKTPLASIQGFSKLLQQEQLPENERKEYARIIAEESARLSHLTSNMIRLSKLENQEIVQQLVPFSLDEQIRKSILLLGPYWEKKNIQWDIHLERAVIPGDEELLQQVWINLIGNAIKFSGDQGRIHVSLTHASSGVQVILRDQGIGMTASIQNRIFEKFYQGEEAHSAEGSGLGLPLVKRILDLHGGTITVESRPYQGSAFIVFIPVK